MSSNDDFASYDDDQDDFDDVDQRGEPVRPNRAARRNAQRSNSRSALRREAEGVDYVGVEYDGETYWVPSDPADWPIDVLAAFEDGKAITALRSLFVADEDGHGGWSTLQAKGYRVRDLNQLFDKVAAAGGFKNSGN